MSGCVGWTRLRTAPAWPNVLKPPASGQVDAAQIGTELSTSAISAGSGAQLLEAGRKAKQAIGAACRALIAAEDELTEMDRITGDGDLGSGMARAARAVQDAVAWYPLDDIPATLKALAHTLRRELGGSSGPLYGVLFLRCGSVLEGARASGLAQWVEALDHGCQAISEMGGAKPGRPHHAGCAGSFVKTLRRAKGVKATREAILAAVEAAESRRRSDGPKDAQLGRWLSGR